MREPRCDTCDYFDAAYGECRRRAPTVAVFLTPTSAHPKHVTAWPAVEPGQWCGEYRHTPDGRDA